MQGIKFLKFLFKIKELILIKEFLYFLKFIFLKSIGYRAIIAYKCTDFVQSGLLHCNYLYAKFFNKNDLSSKKKNNIDSILFLN